MEDKEVLKIAHRGASRYAPENTLLAVKEALRLGADVIEVDVHRTLDGGVIVIHDHSVRRTTGSVGFKGRYCESALFYYNLDRV